MRWLRFLQIFWNFVLFKLIKSFKKLLRNCWMNRNIGQVKLFSNCLPQGKVQTIFKKTTNINNRKLSKSFLIWVVVPKQKTCLNLKFQKLSYLTCAQSSDKEKLSRLQTFLINFSWFHNISYTALSFYVRFFIISFFLFHILFLVWLRNPSSFEDFYAFSPTPVQYQKRLFYFYFPRSTTRHAFISL